MNARQRIQNLLSFKEPDRIGRTDSFWEDTLSRWRQEGFPADVHPADHFGFDFDYIYLDASLRLPERLIEDTDEYTVREDKHGFTAKQWKGHAGALGYLSHAITDEASWKQLKPRLDPDFGKGCRMHTASYFEPFLEWPTWEETKAAFVRIRERERFILVTVYGPFEAIWRAHGFEQTLMDLALQPEFARELFESHVSLVIGVLRDALRRGIRPDGLFLIEDLGFCSGPLMSLDAYRRTLFPAHRRLGAFLDEQGIAYFAHSDGDVRAFIPSLIEAGVKVLQPLEARAGLDVRTLKAQYGRDLTFMGNINVDRLGGSKKDIEKEVRDKVLIAKKGGGYIYHSDHSVPPQVSLENYRTLMKCLHKYGHY
ncbi:MAG: hypothetical protein KAJ81_05180 [Candidatus Latescibacteria bacterium]|nr:hypothetical protein [Candidatus Latescibacterota bacterium]